MNKYYKKIFNVYYEVCKGEERGEEEVFFRLSLIYFFTSTVVSLSELYVFVSPAMISRI